MAYTICRVNHYRMYLGISQRELAELSGTAPNTICEIEAGKRMPNVLLAIRIAKALGTTVEKLWEEHDDGYGK